MIVPVVVPVLVTCTCIAKARVSTTPIHYTGGSTGGLYDIIR